MKWLPRILLLSTASLATAQFDAPNTVSEDHVQRIYPMEAARVLAWVHNQRGAKIASVNCDLNGSDAGGSRWTIVWRDGAGKVLGERSVTVSAANVADGATYYRDVMQQLADSDWAEPSAAPDNAASAFWQGADLAGSTRSNGLAAAGKLVVDRPPIATPADAARLAGALVHAALPSVAGRRPLDSVLLARAAAWLALAEQRLREPLEAPWAPLLFLSGHESAAAAIWSGARGTAKLRASAPRFWQMALHEPSAAEAFVFAARAENRPWMLPALYLLARRDDRLVAPARELLMTVQAGGASTGTDDYPVSGGAGQAASAWLALAANFPTATGEHMPAAIATRQEIEASAPGGEFKPAEHSGSRIDGLTDDTVAQLVKNALAAASAPPAPASAGPDRPSPAIAPPDFTNSDAAWTYIEKLATLDRQPDSPEDAQRRWQALYRERMAAAEKFIAAFPRDPRRWDAKMVIYECASDLMQMGERDVKRPSDEFLEEVIAAPDATEQARGDAAFFRAVRVGDGASISSPHTLPAFHRALSEFISRYPNHRRAPMAAAYQLQLLSASETPGANKILTDLAAHPNPQIATRAKAFLEQRSRITEMKKQPLDLKFTAADGTEIDAAKLRGKIVLLDFWASWCGPCMADAPHVVELYQKYHSRGFEILGINLDQDKSAMEAAAKRVDMTWPQHFDGKGWQNEIAQRFGIRSIPATWLFDQKGKLREVGLRGPELQSGIERLLRGE